MAIKVYLCGPMSGIDNLNFPAFHERAAALRACGFHVINPAETDGGDASKSREYYMAIDIRHVLSCDMVAVLPGWEKSAGALTELAVATAVGRDVMDATTMGVIPRDRVRSVVFPHLYANEEEDVLSEAGRLVLGARGDSYGHPYEDFSRTASIWSAVLGVDVEPEQVALCMIGLKMSRACHKQKRDNMVDIAGYAQTYQMVVNRKRELGRGAA